MLYIHPCRDGPTEKNLNNKTFFQTQENVYPTLEKKFIYFTFGTPFLTDWWLVDFERFLFCRLLIYFQWLSQDDEKTLDEKVNLFNEETFLIKSEANKQRFKCYKEIIYTILASATSARFKGFQFLSKVFPRHHDNPSKETANSPAEAHKEKPFYIAETATLNMVEILNKIQDRYLELLVAGVNIVKPQN